MGGLWWRRGEEVEGRRRKGRVGEEEGLGQVSGESDSWCWWVVGVDSVS